MRRVPTMMMSAGAASLTTLAVAAAVPATGDDGKDQGKGGGVTVIQAGPPPEQLRACLKDHGMDVPDGDPIALKRWLGAHLDDAATADALKACDMGPVTKRSDVPCAVVKPGVPAEGAKRAFRVHIAPPGERGLRTDGE